ncbi:MAG: hypothetical protein HFH08_03795 [Bacilli bacterium]|nr:hypothetical protein [Bacilli bacterium]
MSTIKNYQKAILLMAFVISIPLIVPFMADVIEIVLKLGRIVGTIIRIY